MTLQEELTAKGMKETDFDRHYSDLYIRLTPISKEWRENFKYKRLTSLFTSNIDGDTWIEVPFGAFENYMEERQRGW